MRLEELIAWAHTHHHPQLVLSERPRDVVRHGEQAWHFLFTSTEERIERAMERVQTWQERLQQERECV